ncbi:MAG: glycosyltransferase family 2 protein, partial [Terrimicrobiaceae bacterium]
SQQDVINLCTLADWEVFKSFGHILLPAPLGPLSRFVNRWAAPLFEWACLATFLIAGKRNLPRREPKCVSVVIPARNEAGSVAHAIERMPRLGAETELIFVEGNSTDDTWRVIKALPDTFAHGRIVKLRQTGRGKGNAVREGFRVATGEVLMILDADLTVPPEDLPKFVEVLASGKGDFANGVRLIYPMDGQAMKFANLCANKAFSIVFSWLLGQPVKDTLCGTKALWRADYERIERGRSYFGDFDPFGDFDLLFGADKLNLKIVDVPIRYKERFYGETNIQRWRHGAILLAMVVFAAKRLKFV